jgi:hypothetical protein
LQSQLDKRLADGFAARAQERIKYDQQNPLPKSRYPKITSYNQFESAANDAISKLIHDNPIYAAGKTVPIWELRNAIGDATDRNGFDNYLRQMASNKNVNLGQGGYEDTKEQQINSIDDSTYHNTLYHVTPTKEISSYIPKTKTSYNEFKSKAEKAFKSLEKKHNGFVPVRTLRESMKGVDRSDFNYYLPKMQEDNVFQLRTGGSEMTNQEKNDSLYLPGRGLTVHIARPNS